MNEIDLLVYIAALKDQGVDTAETEKKLEDIISSSVSEPPPVSQ